MVAQSQTKVKESYNAGYNADPLLITINVE